MKYLKVYSAKQILERTSTRKGETKLGERVGHIKNKDNWEAEIKSSKARFVLLGIPEDIGVRANYGIGGARTIWEPALKSILNVQHQEENKLAKELLVLGYLDFSSIDIPQSASIEALRKAVEKIDLAVTEIINKIVICGKTPIIIGGGHNNSYPIIKGTALGLKKRGKISNSSINTINIDAHADLRKKEGRHSGNGFRYAYEEGYLKKYSILGLHKIYLPESILTEIRKNADIQTLFWDDIFVSPNPDWKKIVKKVTKHVKSQPSGLEIDVDSISQTLSSAMTPYGLTVIETRYLIYEISKILPPAYFHICEGATRLDNNLIAPLTSKLVGHLVIDFMFAQMQTKSKK